MNQGMKPRVPGVVEGLIGAAIIALLGVLYRNRSTALDSRWFPAIVVAIVGLALLALVVRVLTRRRLSFVAQMSTADLESRIGRAESTIWTFQISGGDFTQRADAVYRRWLEADSNRRLRILFANPSNEGLLKSLVELSGMGARSSHDVALGYLEQTIRRSIQKYEDLAKACPGQVELRLYDASPPCSIHAIDADIDRRTSSIFIENYLPRTGWADRPCFVLKPGQSHYTLYVDRCAAWFELAHAHTATPLPDPLGT